VANLPGVDIGSTIEVDYEVVTTNRSYVAGFETFQTFDDLDKKEVILKAPKGLDVHTLITGNGIVKQQTNESGDTQTFVLQGQNEKALPAEPSLPPEWLYMGGVDFFVGDIKHHVQELNETMLDRAGKGAKAAELAKGLVKGLNK